MKFIIDIKGGQALEIEVEETDTIEIIKLKIFEKTGISMGKQQLSLEGSSLADDQCVKSFQGTPSKKSALLSSARLLLEQFGLKKPPLKRANSVSTANSDMDAMLNSYHGYGHVCKVEGSNTLSGPVSPLRRNTIDNTCLVEERSQPKKDIKFPAPLFCQHTIDKSPENRLNQDTKASPCELENESVLVSSNITGFVGSAVKDDGESSTVTTEVDDGR